MSLVDHGTRRASGRCPSGPTVNSYAISGTIGSAHADPYPAATAGRRKDPVFSLQFHMVSDARVRGLIMLWRWRSGAWESSTLVSAPNQDISVPTAELSALIPSPTLHFGCRGIGARAIAATWHPMVDSNSGVVAVIAPFRHSRPQFRPMWPLRQLSAIH